MRFSFWLRHMSKLVLIGLMFYRHVLIGRKLFIVENIRFVSDILFKTGDCGADMLIFA